MARRVSNGRATGKRSKAALRAAREQAPRASLYEEVTAKIIAQLEAGVFPWVQPWSASAAGIGLPRNALSGRLYSGINVLILWGAFIESGFASQDWLTFRQALAAGGSVRKGERGQTIFYADRFPWPIILWAIANTSLWLALWPLVLTGIMPLWVGFALAIITITLSYLPSHDAQHDIIAPRGSRHYWFNEFIGYFALIHLATPLSTLRVTHLEHHRHTNDPVRDPDYHMAAATAGGALWKAITKGQAKYDRYGAVLQKIVTAAAKRALTEALIARVAFFGILERFPLIPVHTRTI
jgi:hypothetical protein